jgi:hypothetical protein
VPPGGGPKTPDGAAAPPSPRAADPDDAEDAEETEAAGVCGVDGVPAEPEVDEGEVAPQLTRGALAAAPGPPPYRDDDEDEGEGAEVELPYGGRDVRSSSGPRGCGGTVGETPAGPAMPGVAVTLRPALAFRPPLTIAWPPVSPSAARAWEIRMASMVMSWRISERLQARSASSHMVVRWTGLAPVTSANATIAPFGASSLPLRYLSHDVLL